MKDFDGREGIASTDGSTFPGGVSGFGFMVLILTDDHIDGASPTLEHLQKSITHEIGHSLGAGRADDRKGLNPFSGIYRSAQRNGIDQSFEYFGISGYNDPGWSVMTRRWVDDLESRPMDGNYIAFRLEELTTIEFNNIATVRGG
ncbi:hypothetical protein C475_00105 [Halosimplex carlsbadense 2-9-1]|uniref:Uncharacterized protein n=1 Tax=Halosimplex carlsbadense 2-9-1 TaxID=797114 RepID=M0D8N4_9EURY|nr:hypothetical protein [Halosimplex carlsbadense]ELZ30499.1 hypothetical protein C475_00105 [Halosimplex carlsbadense 2-9-1]